MLWPSSVIKVGTRPEGLTFVILLSLNFFKVLSSNPILAVISFILLSIPLSIAAILTFLTHGDQSILYNSILIPYINSGFK